MNIDLGTNGRSHSVHEPELTITQTIRGTLQVPNIQLEVSSRADGNVSFYDVGLLPVVIGTRPSCNIVVRDPHVTGEHCEIQLTQGGLVFRDKGSKNGSFVGGLRVTECTLLENASVRIGGTRITIRHRGPREIPLWSSDSFGAEDTIVLGRSLLMRTLFAQLEALRHDTRPVILVGESGTGRSLIAEAIYKRMPDRPRFIAVDCAKLRVGREAESLFGRMENGRQPGLLEKASGGLIYLGNIDELPPDVAETLVKVIRTQRILPVGASPAQQRPFRALVIVSVKPGQPFVQGLTDYARAQGAIELFVPALRHRRDDIPMLVEAILAQTERPRSRLDLPPAAHAFFSAYHWPGNVAELHRFVGLCLSIDTVKRYLAEYTGDNTQKPNLESLLPLSLADARQSVVDHFDRAFLKAKLEQFGGNVTQTAKAIGVTRQYLSQLKREHGLGDDET